MTATNAAELGLVRQQRGDGQSASAVKKVGKPWPPVWKPSNSRRLNRRHGQRCADGRSPGQVVIDLSDDEPLIPDTDKGIEIEGSVFRIGPPMKPKADLKFDDNLAEAVPRRVLGGIADEYSCASMRTTARAGGSTPVRASIFRPQDRGCDRLANGSARWKMIPGPRHHAAVPRRSYDLEPTFSEMCPTGSRVAQDSGCFELDDLADALEDLNPHHRSGGR